MCLVSSYEDRCWGMREGEEGAQACRVRPGASEEDEAQQPAASLPSSPLSSSQAFWWAPGAGGECWRDKEQTCPEPILCKLASLRAEPSGEPQGN